MAANQGSCKCGGRLNLGTEIASGVCGHCSRDTRHLRVPVGQDTLTVVSPAELGGVTPEVVSQEPRTVVSHGPDSGEQETKEQRWRRTHADQRRAIHAAGQRSRRSKLRDAGTETSD